MKKICFVNPVEPLRRPLKELVPLLEKKGYEIGVMAPKRIGKKNKDLQKFSSKTNIHTYNALIGLTHFEWPIPLLKFFFTSLRVLWKYDVIQIWANFYLNNFLLILLSYFFPRTKIILTMDVVPGYSLKAGSLDKPLRIYTRTLCKLQFWRANKITLYGKALLSYAKKAKMPMKKVVVLPTGLTFYKRPSQKDANKNLAKSLGLDERELKKHKIVSFIGWLNNRKGADTFIQVASKFKDDDVLFILLGSGPNHKQYKEIVMRLGLNKIRFLGHNKTITHSLLESTDVFFFPSRGEGLAGVIMEAMYQEATVLSTKIPCTTDLIKNGEEGILLPIDDEKGFEKELRRLLNNSNIRNKLVNGAKIKIKEFDWERVLEGYGVLY